MLNVELYRYIQYIMDGGLRSLFIRSIQLLNKLFKRKQIDEVAKMQ